MQSLHLIRKKHTEKWKLNFSYLTHLWPCYKVSDSGLNRKSSLSTKIVTFLVFVTCLRLCCFCHRWIIIYHLTFCHTPNRWIRCDMSLCTCRWIMCTDSHFVMLQMDESVCRFMFHHAPDGWIVCRLTFCHAPEGWIMCRLTFCHAPDGWIMHTLTFYHAPDGCIMHKLISHHAPNLLISSI